MTTAPARPRAAWHDTSADVASRVAALMAEMTAEEKVAQLHGVWVGADGSGAGVAPHQAVCFEGDGQAVHRRTGQPGGGHELTQGQGAVLEGNQDRHRLVDDPDGAYTLVH